MRSTSLSPHATVGDGFAEPGTAERIEIVFGPPATFPRAVDGFQVPLSVRDVSGLLREEMSTFAPAASRRGLFMGPETQFWGSMAIGAPADMASTAGIGMTDLWCGGSSLGSSPSP